jgi:hypothetical protein
MGVPLKLPIYTLEYFKVQASHPCFQPSELLLLTALSKCDMLLFHFPEHETVSFDLLNFIPNETSNQIKM